MSSIIVWYSNDVFDSKHICWKSMIFLPKHNPCPIWQKNHSRLLSWHTTWAHSHIFVRVAAFWQRFLNLANFECLPMREGISFVHFVQLVYIESLIARNILKKWHVSIFCQHCACWWWLSTGMCQAICSHSDGHIRVYTHGRLIFGPCDLSWIWLYNDLHKSYHFPITMIDRLLKHSAAHSG